MPWAKENNSHKSRRPGETVPQMHRSRAKEINAGGTMVGAKAKVSRKPRRHCGTGKQMYRSRAREIKARGPYAVGESETLTQVEASQRDWTTNA